MNPLSEKIQWETVRFDRESRDAMRMTRELFSPMLRDGEITEVKLPHPKRAGKIISYYVLSIKNHPLRDDGLKMGVNVIEGVSQGNPHHIALTKEYRPCLSM